MISNLPGGTTAQISRRTGLLLLGVIGMAAFLRFHQLGRESLWGDEIISWLQSNQASPGAIIALMRASSLHPPGHNLVLYAVMRLLGDSELALRLPSAIAGVLAVPMVFQVARELFGVREGLLAASFLAVLRAPIYYSQEARPYSLMLLFTLVTAYCWLRIMRRLAADRPLPRRWVGAFIASSIFLAYQHYFGLLWVGLLGVAAGLSCLRRRRDLGRWIAIYLPIVLAYLPWVPAMTVDYGANGWIQAPSSDTVPIFLQFLFNESESLLLLVTPLIVLFVLQALADRVTRSRPSRFLAGDLGIVLWFATPLLLVYGLSLVGTPVLSNRNLLIVLPAACLLLARAIARQPLPEWGRALLGGGYAALFLAHLIWGADYYSKVQKPQFRETAAYVLAQADRYPDAIIVGYPGTLFDYYLARGEPPLRTDLAGGFPERIAPLADEVAARDARYIWFLAGGRQPPRPGYLTALQTAYTELDQKDFFQARVWLFEQPPAQPVSAGPVSESAPPAVPLDAAPPASETTATGPPAVLPDRHVPPVSAGAVYLRVRPPSGQLWSDESAGFRILNEWSPDDQRFFIQKLNRDGLWLQFVIRNRDGFVFNARFPLADQTHDDPLDLVLSWEDGSASAYVNGGLVKQLGDLDLPEAAWDLPVMTPGEAETLLLESFDQALSAADVTARFAAAGEP